jgi:16S rRNA (uracil1498-N3)-methyltransferase
VHARFYAPGAADGGRLVDLPPEEARHLARVLRLRAGAEVRVFDGAGHEFRAVVETVGRAGVRVRLVEPVAAAPEPRVRVTVAQAVLKGDHMDAVVRDATMLGAAAIRPLATARTQVAAAALARRRGVERWRRVAVAAAKQSRRAVVPAVSAPTDLAAYLAEVSARERLCLMLVEPGAPPPAAREAALLTRLPPPAEADLLVGPEGGWSPDELEAGLRAGCVLLTLGRRTLRADAVALVALAVLLFAWGDF